MERTRIPGAFMIWRSAGACGGLLAFFRVRPGDAARRANICTVIGAGAYSVAVSGSTICYQGMSFPLPSLPTGKVPFTGPEDLPGLEAAVREQYRIFDGECAICMDGMQAPSYALVEQAAQALARAMAPHWPKVVSSAAGHGQALGQALMRAWPKDTPFLCMDGIALTYGDTVDIGAPLSGGRVIPVIVKSWRLQRGGKGLAAKRMSGGHTYSFRDVREVMGKANEEKSGDQLCGVAAQTPQERVAARIVLSEMTVKEICEHPAVPYEQDEVTRLILDGLNLPIYREYQNMTIGELRERILSAPPEELTRMGRGLSSEVIAAVCKLMSNLDLIYAAARMRVKATCVTTIGEPGTLSARLQPNHPVDDVEGITASVLEGLSFGMATR